MTAAIDLAKTVLEAAGYRVLTPRQVGELDRALPHQLDPETLQCLSDCRRCKVVGLLY